MTRTLPSIRSAACALGAAALLGFAPSSWGLPSGGTVVAGQARIDTRAGTLTVTEASNKAVLNWNRFDINPGETVDFIQPNASSAVLNRVVGEQPTAIFGHLDANGQVFLVNPQGILFARGASVNVGGLLASTLGISSVDFMAGDWHLRGSSTAAVRNQGSIGAAPRGFVALLGARVSNQGLITARLGSVVLGAGSDMTLDLGGDGLLRVAVKRGALASLAANGGLIQADGGKVLLTARAAGQLLGGAVNDSGVIQAQRIASRGGAIVLLGDPGSGSASVSGALDASAQAGRGGRIAVSAHQVEVLRGATLDARGAQGGGSVELGGGLHGADASLPAARRTTIEAGSTVDASASVRGSGGSIAVWSEVGDAAGVTEAHGALLARGAGGGAGGIIETSGHTLNVDGAAIDTSARAGSAGTWLLDPYDVTIRSGGSSASATNPYNPGADSIIDPSSIVNALDAGGNVTITTGSTGTSSGDITLASDIVTGPMAGHATLRLQAQRNIVVDSNVAIDATRNANANALDVVLQANAANTGGAIDLGPGASIKSNGGAITLGGGGDPATGYAQGNAGAYGNGVTLSSNSQLWSAGGAITLRGSGYATTPTQASDRLSGVEIDAGTSIDAGRGTISINGVSNAGAGSSVGDRHGVELNGSGGAITLSSSNTTARAIRIVGTPGQGAPTSGGEAVRIDTTRLDVSGGLTIAGDTLSFVAATVAPAGSTAGLAITPSPASSFLDGFTWSGSAAGADFVGSGSVSGLGIDNYASLSALQLGAPGNSQAIAVTSPISVNGSITVIGGSAVIDANLTSTNTGDIWIEGSRNSSSSVLVNSGVTIAKTGGAASTLTLRGGGRVTDVGSVTASGAGDALNVVEWANYSGANLAGVSGTGKLETDGGKVWIGGSAHAGSSSTWEGLTVGDAGSVGSGGANFNALDFTDSIHTGGGDVYIWAGHTSAPGVGGLVNGAGSGIDAGGGNITLRGDVFSWPWFPITTTGTFSLVPDSASFGEGINTSWFDFSGATLGGLILGAPGNQAPITVTSAQTVAGPIALYGGTVAIGANLTSSAHGAPLEVQSTGAITQGASSRVTTDGGNVTYDSNANDAGAGYIWLQGASAGGGAAIVTHGGDITLSGGRDVATGYATGDGAGNGNGVTLDTVSLLSGGGNIVVRGRSSTSQPGYSSSYCSPCTNDDGIRFYGSSVIDAGTGTVDMQGVAAGMAADYASNGIETSQNGYTRILSAATDTTAIRLDGDAGASVGSGQGSSRWGTFLWGGNGFGIVIAATGAGGAVDVSGQGGGNASGAGGVHLEPDVYLLASSGAIALKGAAGASSIYSDVDINGTVGFSPTLAGFGINSPVTASSSDIQITADSFSADHVFGSGTFIASAVQSAGTLGIAPRTPGKALAIQDQAPASGTLWIDPTRMFGSSGLFKSGFSGFMFGSSTTGTLTLDPYGFDQATTLETGAGAVLGNVTMPNSVLTVDVTGAGPVTQSGTLIASGLQLDAPSATVTLEAPGNLVGTLAAHVAVLSLRDAGALTVGSLGVLDGVAASGAVDIETRAGNLTLDRSVATTSTAPGAVVLAAGQAAQPGSGRGGDIVLGGGATVSTGAGGRALLYTGSVAGSRGLSALVGLGSGHFRYDSSRTTSNFSLALGDSGTFAVYREQPIIRVTPSAQDMTYGGALPSFTGRFDGYVNGDLSPALAGGTAIWSIGGARSTTGHLVAGAHDVAYGSGLNSALGYGFADNPASSGELSVYPLALTVAGETVAAKAYDGSTAASLSGGTLHGVVPGDAVVLGQAGAFASKNVGSRVAVLAHDTLAGAAAGNYVLMQPAGLGAAITRLDAVSWVGPSSGNWFDPANWAGGAVPDLSNVASVLIPHGVTVNFDTAGVVAPAQVGAVQLATLAGAGNLAMPGGTLDVAGTVQLGSLSQSGGRISAGADVNVGELAQTGGSLDAGGDLTVSASFAQSAAASIATTGATSITQRSGPLSVASLSAGSMRLAADGGGVTLGELHATGALSVSSSGAVSQAAGARLSVGGDTQVHAGLAVTLDQRGNALLGPISATGQDIVLRNGTATQLGKVNAAGALALNSAGSVAQLAGASVVVRHDATLVSRAGDVMLSNAGNGFSGMVSMSGANLALRNGGSTLVGNTGARGTLSVTSLGDIHQLGGSLVTAGGRATFSSIRGVVSMGPGGISFGAGLSLSGRQDQGQQTALSAVETMSSAPSQGTMTSDLDPGSNPRRNSPSDAAASRGAVAPGVRHPLRGVALSVLGGGINTGPPWRPRPAPGQRAHSGHAPS